MDQITVGLFGFGRTGRIIAQELLENECIDLKWVVRHTRPEDHAHASDFLLIDYDAAPIYCNLDLDVSFFEENKVDVIIDFSSIDGYKSYIEAAEKVQIKVVSAISNYPNEAVQRLKKAAEKTTVLYSPNITIGINFLIIASEILQNLIPEADIQIVETHFKGKEKPSGTSRKITKLLGLDEEETLHSVRVGGVIGQHEVIFGLPNQTIRIVHDSISKKAFGQGAIYATKAIQKENGGYHTMEELISRQIKNHLPD